MMNASLFCLQFECCGVSSYEDWYDIKSWSGKRWVPESCCRPIYEKRGILVEGSGDSVPRVECGRYEMLIFVFNKFWLIIIFTFRSENPMLWWDKGCAHSLQSWLTDKLDVIGVVGLGIAFAQLFGLITSMLLFCTVKHKKDSDTYKSYSPSIDPQTRPSSWEDWTKL